MDGELQMPNTVEARFLSQPMTAIIPSTYQNTNPTT